jgi:hypothetical protein
MKLSSKIYIAVLSVSSLIVLNQACSNIVAFDKAQDSDSSKVSVSGNPVPSPSPSSTSTPNPNPSATPSPMPTSDVDLGSTCSQKKANGQLRTYQERITFIQEAQTCAWGQGDNLSIKDGYVRARKEQLINLGLPSGAVVCNVTMDHQASSTFLYDDNVLLTLNGFIYASTSNFNQYFSSVNSASGKKFYKYEWLKFRDKPAQNSAGDTTASNQYCAGVYCQFPLTEQTGKIDLNIGAAAIQGILSISSVNSISLGAITTGDNDSTDCIHQPIVLDIMAEYY